MLGLALLGNACAARVVASLAPAVAGQPLSLPNDLGREVPFQLTIQGRPLAVRFKKIRDSRTRAGAGVSCAWS
jgi:hypothetical protein